MEKKKKGILRRAGRDPANRRRDNCTGRQDRGKSKSAAKDLLR